MPRRVAPNVNASRSADDFQMASLVNVKLEDVVMPEYQRMFVDSWAHEIAENWNPLLFRPPLLGRRPDGKYDVIDGQHTTGALRLRGHDEMPAYVREGLDIETEAGTFADMQTQRRGLRPFEVWRAEYLAKRGWAVTLHDIAGRYGLKVAHERGPNNIACIGQCRIIFRRDNGAQLLDQALDILTAAYPDVSDPANETRVERGLVSGMVDLLGRVPIEGKLFERDRWVAKLQDATFRADGQVARITPRSFPSYMARLIESGKLPLTSVQTGSGQSVMHGRALSLIILGDARTKQLYK